MFAEIGHVALILAFIVAVFQSVLPMIGAHRNQPRLIIFGDKAAAAQLFLIALSFICLTAAFIGSAFSVKLAASHSHLSLIHISEPTRPY